MSRNNCIVHTSDSVSPTSTNLRTSQKNEREGGCLSGASRIDICNWHEQETHVASIAICYQLLPAGRTFLFSHLANLQRGSPALRNLPTAFEQWDRYLACSTIWGWGWGLNSMDRRKTVEGHSQLSTFWMQFWRSSWRLENGKDDGFWFLPLIRTSRVK